MRLPFRSTPWCCTALLLAVLALSCGPTQSPCGPSTCSGCCQGDVCLEGSAVTACGASGNACDVCVRQDCLLGHCVSSATGGGSGGGGGVTTDAGAGVDAGTAADAGTGGSGGGGGAPACRSDQDCPYRSRCFDGSTPQAHCEPFCHFTGASGCSAGQACSFVSTGASGEWIPECGAAGLQQEGEPCTRRYLPRESDCAPEFVCQGFQGVPALCHRKCDTAHPCPLSGQRCLDVDNNGLTFCYAPRDACSTSGQQCPAGRVCTSNQGLARCVCAPGLVEQGGACVCVPQCSGKACGDDGCGGSCGACGALQSCNASNQCVCAPQCSGKTCGPDGCGGSCGACQSGQACSTAGRCACQPSCTGKTCGSDGCGGSCGTCAGTNVCSTAGQCQACQPSCSGKSCGPDGCGGTCGTCSGTQLCASGQCQACDPVSQLGCAVGERCRWNGTAPQCTTVIGTGTQGAQCSSDSSCAKSFLCAGVANNLNCRKYCTTDSNCGTGGKCAFPLAGALGVCSTPCDPLTSGSCSSFSEQCYAFSVSNGPAEVTDCQLAGSRSEGGACSAVNTCATNTCVSGACRKLCSPGNSSTCGSGRTCTAVPGWSHYGACL